MRAPIERWPRRVDVAETSLAVAHTRIEQLEAEVRRLRSANDVARYAAAAEAAEAEVRRLRSAIEATRVAMSTSSLAPGSLEGKALHALWAALDGEGSRR